ncbi:hypothetical protein M9H77_34900 [Catharanthus roseus]|uniref:Uncharacterized protein n=1 Tax=Catharanthus roseus TaxID=4058 RepID=A0ACB9ZR42_CATRO|nr:hypothetical protein M9H77_34900 [Catharanthus roseus]
MALLERVLKYLAEVQRCPLKPLVERFFANSELASLCELNTHDKKPYIHYIFPNTCYCSPSVTQMREEQEIRISMRKMLKKLAEEKEEVNDQACILIRSYDVPPTISLIYIYIYIYILLQRSLKTTRLYEDEVTKLKTMKIRRMVRDSFISSLEETFFEKLSLKN